MKHSIPPQHDGKQLDHFAEITFDNDKQSRDFYQIARSRLLHPYEWYRIAKVPGATFVLADKSGRKLIRKMREGDFLQIDIPGPGSSVGDGYDWVLIEEIRDQIGNPSEESCYVTVRPAANPKSDDYGEIAHFFEKMATSTFLIKRVHTNVRAEYHGRNEVINLDTSKLSDKLRNSLVGIMAKLGLSTPQWKGLIEGFVDPKIKAE